MSDSEEAASTSPFGYTSRVTSKEDAFAYMIVARVAPTSMGVGSDSLKHFFLVRYFHPSRSPLPTKEEEPTYGRAGVITKPTKAQLKHVAGVI